MMCPRPSGYCAPLPGSQPWPPDFPSCPGTRDQPSSPVISEASSGLLAGGTGLALTSSVSQKPHLCRFLDETLYWTGLFIAG